MPVDGFAGPAGATPLEPDDIRGLIPTWVATRGDLNAAEYANILKAMQWAEASKMTARRETLLTSVTLRELHRRMFSDVWRWAGDYRRRDTNIGDSWPYVPARVEDLLADALAQTARPTQLPWSADEVAVRFHHRLVSVHPFVNGNGRHARLAADLLVITLGRPVFSWGGADLASTGSSRERYLSALRRADRDLDYAELLEFARS